MSEPVEGVDAGTDRVVQSAVGIVLLAAFVFRLPLVVPALMIVLAAGALAGPRANVLDYAFERWIKPRLPARAGATVEDPIPVATVRAQDALGAVVLAIAGVSFLLGIGAAGWALALVEAVVAIVAATTRVHVADRLRRGL